MTIYDAIVKKIADGEEKIPITCIRRGKGILRGIYPRSVYPISVRFDEYEGGDGWSYSENFTKYGINSGESTLAIGHFDSPEKTAQAIKDQNFDTEGV